LRIWSALLFVPLIGCDLFSAETQLDNVCMQLDNRSIDGVPSGKLTRSFSYDDLSLFDGFISADATVSDLSVTLTGVRGVSDLSFLESVHVSIESNGLPPADVIACDDGECASDTLTSTVHVTAPPRLTDYALGGAMKITLSVSGDLPKTDWAANLRVCLSGSAKVAIGF
jgi:hypothetical protein